MNKKVLVPIANDIEEIEMVTVVDVLRRAEANVTIASIDQLEIRASRGVKIVADALLADCVSNEYDLIVLPGGMPGAEHLRDCDALINMLKKQEEAGRLFAAICASPLVVFHQKGIGVGLKMTCFPSMIDQLEKGENALVVVDQNCITSQGPGTAMQFAIKLVELLFDVSTAQEVASGLLA